MRWSELDEARGMWTLLAARAKNNHAHTLPLPPAAWAVINSAPRLAARDHYARRTRLQRLGLGEVRS